MKGFGPEQQLLVRESARELFGRNDEWDPSGTFGNVIIGMEPDFRTWVSWPLDCIMWD